MNQARHCFAEPDSEQVQRFHRRRSFEMNCRRLPLYRLSQHRRTLTHLSNEVRAAEFTFPQGHFHHQRASRLLVNFCVAPLFPQRFMMVTWRFCSIS